MAPSHNQTPQSSSSLHRDFRASPRRWLLLGGGSAFVHLLVIYSLGGVQTLGQLSAVSAPAATPVELIDLPSAESESVTSAPLQAPTAAQAATAEPANPESANPEPANPAKRLAEPVLHSANSSYSSGDISSGDISSGDISSGDISSGDIGIASSAVPRVQTEQPAASNPTPAAIAPAVSPSSDQAAVAQASQLPSFSSASPIPAASPATAQIARVRPQPEHLTVPSPSPSPLITTERIDVPIPDVSQTWTSPALPSPTIAQAVVIPSYLTASLTTDPLPVTAEVEPEPIDVAVQPTATSRIFSSNPALSPCPVRQEAIAFLGQTVALQVKTNARGQVVETVTQTSSQNAAYDELATCLVKSWKFEPATAQGQAVANGLLVHITIDRS